MSDARETIGWNGHHFTVRPQSNLLDQQTPGPPGLGLRFWNSAEIYKQKTIPEEESAAAAAAKLLQSCPTLCDPIDGSPPRLPCPWDSPGKNTGVGCHFLLQCMKVKSESEVAQSCLTLSDSMDCSLPGSSIHGIFRQEYWSGVPLPSLEESQCS